LSVIVGFYEMVERMDDILNSPFTIYILLLESYYYFRFFIF
jgi:hypothetical protein